MAYTSKLVDLTEPPEISPQMALSLPRTKKLLIANNVHYELFLIVYFYIILFDPKKPHDAHLPFIL